MKYQDIHKKKKGFSLLEILLSVTLVAMLFSVAIPIFLSFYTKNDFDISTNTIGQSLRRAQILSQASDGDSSWGVRVDTGNIVLFKGSSYGVRDASYDESYELSTTITPSGLQEVVFGKFNGEPLQTGTMTITLNDGTVRNISINEKGTISY